MKPVSLHHDLRNGCTIRPAYALMLFCKDRGPFLYGKDFKLLYIRILHLTDAEYAYFECYCDD